MDINYGLNLSQSQKLVMTTQLKQSLNILTMNNFELENEIKKEAEENPLLDLDELSANNEINWEDYIKDLDKSNISKIKETDYNREDINFENVVRYKANIYEYLKSQINLYKLQAEELQVCNYIIDSLDENGYLHKEDEKEIINKIKISNEFFEKCLEYVQILDPSGVGCRSLPECLIIQLKNLKIKDEILEKIVKNDLDFIGKNKFIEIVKKYNISKEKCCRYFEIIKSLNPKPGKDYSIEKTSYVSPDVIITKIGDEFVLTSNDTYVSSIKINNYYKDILSQSTNKEAKKFINDKLNSASNLIKNVESRKTTIMKIATEIVKKQDSFFRYGMQYIKPMKMQDIAEELGFHQSTISRGVNGKYMLTPFGLFEFKYFFSCGIEGNVDEDISTTSIKKFIQDKIKYENKNKPLSDEQISKILKEDGINVARRTVAKYREEMGILSSSKRKQYS